MKIVFFRNLLFDSVTREWTAAQQIVYSHLLSQSILRLDGIFREGGISIDYAEVILDYSDETGKIKLAEYSVQKLSSVLNLSRQKIYDCIDFLSDIGYIYNNTRQDDCAIYCPRDIIYHGFFELKVGSGLSKKLLIFYSWLYERAQHYNGTIDTFSYKLAELFGEKENNIRTMLCRLAEKGYVKRIETEDRRYGKLKILNKRILSA